MEALKISETQFLPSSSFNSPRCHKTYEWLATPQVKKASYIISVYNKIDTYSKVQVFLPE